MSDLRNIPLSKVIALPIEEQNRYFGALQFVTPDKSAINQEPKDINEVSYGDVVEMRRGFGQIDMIYKSFECFYGLDQDSVNALKVVDFFKVSNYIRDVLKKTVEVEAEHLRSDQDPEWEEAGVEALNQFGELNALISLAEKFSTSPLQVEQWQYGFVFALLLQLKTSNEVSKKYMEIVRSKDS